MSRRVRTLGRWLDRAERELKRARVAFGQIASNAHDEALALLLHAAGLPLDSPPAVLKRNLGGKEAAAFLELLRRRVEERIPTPYLTGEAWLGGERFQIDERAIIPRSYFVEILPRLELPFRPDLMADVCAGSACLAILLAKRFPRAKVDAIELDPGAAEVARINIGLHRLGRRVRLWQSDLFASVPLRRYDLILSNPPYEPTRRLDRLPPEFRREPRRALDGGGDGLSVIRRLVPQSLARLAPGGLLLIEAGGLRRPIDREFARLSPEWLPTEDGSDCVCLFRRPA